MDAIEEVKAREILDSRGNPTLEVEVVLVDGSRGRAAVPSGASTGNQEALELRDGDPKRYGGKGVLKAINNIEQEMAPAILGLPALDQEALDQKLLALDGTPQKARLGANAILGVSLAVAHAAAAQREMPLYRYLGGLGAHRLPVPMMNLINGGRHAPPGAADFQEFMVVPVGAGSFAQALQMGAEVQAALRGVLEAKGIFSGVGDEGGLVPPLARNEEGLELLVQAIEKAGYRPGQDLFLALDIAASNLYQKGKYIIRKNGHALDSRDLVDYYEGLAASHPLFSLEDGLAEEDWAGWRLLTERLGKKLLIVGDDLYVTQVPRLERGIKEKASNAILIKPNQVGTLTETLACVERARQAGFVTIISHRSGETEDTTIADLAVGVGAALIKAGAPCRSERLAKYNRLLRIEEELGPAARFAGRDILR